MFSGVVMAQPGNWGTTFLRILNNLQCLVRRSGLKARHAAAIDGPKCAAAIVAPVLSPADKEKNKPLESGGFPEPEFVRSTCGAWHKEECNLLNYKCKSPR
jgi:hypothetical protein